MQIPLQWNTNHCHVTLLYTFQIKWEKDFTSKLSIEHELALYISGRLIDNIVIKSTELSTVYPRAAK